jgi:hypothetical protein
MRGFFFGAGSGASSSGLVVGALGRHAVDHHAPRRALRAPATVARARSLAAA